jgi:serine/threonine protein phosphatase 1
MPRSFIIGDIHGNYEPMMELFHKVNLDYNNDFLISLGDLVDRGPESVRVVDELMAISNFTFVMGNHDYWFYEYLKSGSQAPEWLFQGGKQTLKNYSDNPGAAERHFNFFSSALPYHHDGKNRLFVHAGFDWSKPFSLQKDNKQVLFWDRTLFAAAVIYEEKRMLFEEFHEIYIGHSPTQLLNRDCPVRLSNLYMMDTGAGHRQFLSLLDLESKEFWQSKCTF